MLARLLPGAQFFSLENLERAGESACRVICISAVPPHAASHAAYLARRLKKRRPDLKVVVALWASEGLDRLKPRLLANGVDAVFTQLAEVVAHLQQFPTKQN